MEMISKAMFWLGKILGVTAISFVWMSVISVEVIGNLTGLRADIVEFFEYLARYTI